jgi:hypothetical protein
MDIETIAVEALKDIANLEGEANKTAVNVLARIADMRAEQSTSNVHHLSAEPLTVEPPALNYWRSGSAIPHHGHGFLRSASAPSYGWWSGLEGLVSKHRACGSYGPQHLQAWREHRKMTLEAVAEAVGVTHQQIRRVERRQQPYSQELLEALAKLYQTTPAFLIEVHPDDADRVKAIWDYSNFIRPKRQ